MGLVLGMDLSPRSRSVVVVLQVLNVAGLSSLLTLSITISQTSITRRKNPTQGSGTAGIE